MLCCALCLLTINTDGGGSVATLCFCLQSKKHVVSSKEFLLLIIDARGNMQCNNSVGQVRGLKSRHRCMYNLMSKPFSKDISDALSCLNCLMCTCYESRQYAFFSVQTFLSCALASAARIVQLKCIEDPTCCVGVMLMGTDKHNVYGDFKDLYMLHKMQEPTASTVVLLQKYACNYASLESEVGVMAAEGSRMPIDTALWAASHEFSARWVAVHISEGELLAYLRCVYCRVAAVCVFTDASITACVLCLR